MAMLKFKEVKFFNFINTTQLNPIKFDFFRILT
jgi:hypothetical protein